MYCIFSEWEYENNFLNKKKKKKPIIIIIKIIAAKHARNRFVLLKCVYFEICDDDNEIKCRTSI